MGRVTRKLQRFTPKCKEKYDMVIESVGSIGISAMMHGYMVFDKNDNF